jgi:hypothetical protein
MKKIYYRVTKSSDPIIQWAPLNRITLGPRQADPINRMIPLNDTDFSINSKQAMEIFKKMIPLTE